MVNFKDLVSQSRPGKERYGLKADIVRSTLMDPNRGPLINVGALIERENLAIKFIKNPEFITDKLGNVIGVDATVRAYDRGGRELIIDPHRRCTNVPLLVPDGTFRTVVDPISPRTYQLSNFREDPQEAYLQWLEQTISKHHNPSGFNTNGTVDTVYGATGTAGGEIVTYDAVYTNSRDGLTGIVFNNGNVERVGQEFAVDTNYYVVETFDQFDTSGLPDTNVISIAVIEVYGSGLTTVAFTIRARDKNYGASVNTGDWIKPADASALTLLSSMDTSELSLSGYVELLPNGDNLKNAINVSGTTYIAFTSSRHEAGTVPAVDPLGFEICGWYSSDETGSTKDPKLTITHAAPSTYLSIPRRTLLGVGI